MTNTESSTQTIVSRERRRSLMLRAWILCGLFFMALPGTLLGFSNLMAISAHHGMANLPAAWMEGHGHAQMFGWIGSFILGIGFYSQPARARQVLNVQAVCFGLWTSGVALSPRVIVDRAWLALSSHMLEHSAVLSRNLDTLHSIVRSTLRCEWMKGKPEVIHLGVKPASRTHDQR